MPTSPNHNTPVKSWLKVIVETPSEAADEIAGFISTLTGCGVEYAEQPAPDSSSRYEKIIGYIADDSDRVAKEAELRSFLNQLSAYLAGSLPSPPITLHTEFIEEEDWNQTWKQHFKPLRITPRLVIKPTWEPYMPSGDEAVIEMDPGMAFGTGHHASTKLALEFIESLFFSERPRPQKVLDVGTGTGILGMACAKFGADCVVAVDNDPEAVSVAKDNVAQNGLADIMTVSTQTLEAVTGPFDLIAANITHDILTELASSVSTLLAPGGNLILSGILRGEQLESIRATYEQQNLTLAETKVLTEWGALLFTRQRQASKS